MKKFILGLQFIFKPNYWLIYGEYNNTWDKILNKLLDENDFVNIGEYTAELGGVTIWIANIPYACMMPYNKTFIRPSRLTIQRGVRKLKIAQEKQLEIQLNNLIRK